MTYARSKHSLCTDGRYLYVSGCGGAAKPDKLTPFSWKNSRSVERYDPLGLQWTVLPRMNEGRTRHSSCCLNEMLYVFCGQNFSREDMNSIERLDLSKRHQKWHLVYFSSLVLPPCANPSVSAFNSDKILIIGGEQKLPDGYDKRKFKNGTERLCNMVIFDAKTCMITNDGIN